MRLTSPAGRWSVAAAILCSGSALMLLGGSLGDLFGHRRVLMVGCGATLPAHRHPSLQHRCVELHARS